MEDCLHLFPSTTKGLLKTAFSLHPTFEIHAQLMSHTLWEVKIAAAADLKEGKCSCFYSDLRRRHLSLCQASFMNCMFRKAVKNAFYTEGLSV